MAINIEKIEYGDSGEKARNIIYNNDKRIVDNVYEKSETYKKTEVDNLLTNKVSKSDISKYSPNGLDFAYPSRVDAETDAMSIIQEIYFSAISSSIDLSAGVSISALAIRKRTDGEGYGFSFQLMPGNATSYDQMIIHYNKIYDTVPTNVEEFYIIDSKCKLYLRVDFSKLGLRDVVYDLKYRICKVVNIIDKDSQLWHRLTNTNINQWFGKKVVWIGQSISYGQKTFNNESYASYASKKLGFSIVPAMVPGVGIHAISENGKLKALPYGSTCLSKAEYLANGTTIADAPRTPWLPGSEGTTEHPGIGYNNYYRTWENIFNEANKDADLWVFDVVPHNYTSAFGYSDWDLFDYDKWEYSDGSSFEDHRTTFLGALLFLMDKMYSINPKARMVLLLGSSFNYEIGKIAFSKLAEKWNIPVIDIWSKVNRSPKSLSVIYSNNGTDQHISDHAHEVLGNIVTNELLLIS